MGDFSADRRGEERHRRLRETFSGRWLRKDFSKKLQISLLEVVVRCRKKELARWLLLVEGVRSGKFYGLYINKRCNLSWEKGRSERKQVNKSIIKWLASSDMTL